MSFRDWMNRRKERNPGEETELLYPEDRQEELSSPENPEEKWPEEAAEMPSPEAEDKSIPARENLDSDESGPRSRARGIVFVISCILGVIASGIAGFSGFIILALENVRSVGTNYSGDGKPTAAELEVAKILNGSGMNHAHDFFVNIMIFAIVIAAACLIAAVISCGKKKVEGGVYLYSFDKIWTEVQVFVAAMSLLLVYPAGMVLFETGNGINNSFWPVFRLIMQKWNMQLSSNQMTVLHKWVRENANQYTATRFPGASGMLLAVLMGLAIVLCVGAVTISIARKLKNRSFWKYTLVGTVCRGVYRGTGNFLSSRNHLMRAALIIGLAGIFFAGLIDMASGGPFGMLILAVLFCIFIPREARRFESVREGARKIRDGDVDYKIPDLGKGELGQMADDINSIADAQDAAVQNLMKNERMKTALISNVSHDLKTPLTSIVTYVDLLKKEGLDSENAPEYLEVLDQKTKRLQRLTQNLFDAAKASSGDLPVNLTRLDMVSIANQALGEMQDDLQARNLKVILQNHADDTQVKADGQLLWRVIENMLTNVKKYAMPGTRVYMDIRDAGEEVELSVKNISAAQLNISTDELMQRFTRGDDSRSTEGSGLGLAIAQDLSRMMHGSFQIAIDGDLFTAIVRLPKADK
ncbi:MAG: histidine kinase dimerization/phospho-acceptor domain-containing protein [Eubacterium sp.]